MVREDKNQGGGKGKRFNHEVTKGTKIHKEESLRVPSVLRVLVWKEKGEYFGNVRFENF